jgi:hypothetical protein
MFGTVIAKHAADKNANLEIMFLFPSAAKSFSDYVAKVFKNVRNHASANATNQRTPAAGMPGAGV